MKENGDEGGVQQQQKQRKELLPLIRESELSTMDPQQYQHQKRELSPLKNEQQHQHQQQQQKKRDFPLSTPLKMDVLICPICKDKFRTIPIVLPCGWTVCDRHVRNKDLVNCPGCHVNHSQQKEPKFPVNKTVDLQIKLQDTEANLQRTIEKFSVFKNAHNDPYGFEILNI